MKNDIKTCVLVSLQETSFDNIDNRGVGGRGSGVIQTARFQVSPYPMPSSRVLERKKAKVIIQY